MPLVRTVLILTALLPLLAGCASKAPAGLSVYTKEYPISAERTLEIDIMEDPSARAEAPRPAMVIFHGGAWLYGGREDYYPHAEFFARRGYIVFLPEYRTFWPNGTGITDAVRDGRSAMRWVRGNAGRWNLDRERIYALGSSAGAHLAASAHLLDVYNHPLPDPAIDPSPDGLVLISLVAESRWDEGWPRGPDNLVTKNRYRIIFRGEQDAVTLQPRLNGPMPPMILFHGGEDWLVPPSQSRNFAIRAAHYGTPVELYIIRGMGHDYLEEHSEGLRGACLLRAHEFLQEHAASKKTLQKSRR